MMPPTARYLTARQVIWLVIDSQMLVVELHQKVGFDNCNHNWLDMAQFIMFFVTYE
jgi:hypothetical protein